MGLTKSPAGVPWNLPIDTFISLESNAYVARLVSEWSRDPRRTSVLKEEGLSEDQVSGGLKIAAVGIWHYYGDALMERFPHPEGRTIRRVAGLHKQAYLESKRMNFVAWSEFVRDAVIPVVKGEVTD